MLASPPSPRWAGRGAPPLVRPRSPHPHTRGARAVAAPLLHRRPAAARGGWRKGRPAGRAKAARWLRSPASRPRRPGPQCARAKLTTPRGTAAGAPAYSCSIAAVRGAGGGLQTSPEHSPTVRAFVASVWSSARTSTPGASPRSPSPLSVRQTETFTVPLPVSRHAVST